MDDLLALFLAEARESLALLADDLATLGRRPEDAPARGRARRVLHTLKGSCGFLGLDEIAALAHRGEDVLGGAGDIAALGGVCAAIGGLLEGLGEGAAAPATSPWGALPALGAHLARALGKGFDLVVEDGAVALDPATARALARVLPHLLRNAAGHGLEPPAARQALGKPARGRIAVTARADADGLTVTVADDGRGFDLAALARAAALRGTAAAEPAAAMDPAATAALAFAPGLTTAPAVTPLAGRGIGLDAVKSEIEALDGTVAVDTAEGRGTTIVLRVPRQNAAPARAA